MDRSHKSNFKAYVYQETNAVLNGETLLTPEQVMARLGITKRQLQTIHRGENPKGLYLPAYRLGKKTIRYRLKDVLRLEWESLHKE
jgi:hypothetical protein